MVSYEKTSILLKRPSNLVSQSIVAIRLYLNEFGSAACPEDLPFKEESRNGYNCCAKDPFGRPQRCRSCTRTMTQNCDNYGGFSNSNIGMD